MADEFTFKINGLDQYLREIKDLPNAIRDRLVKGAVATACSVHRKAAIAKAPIFTEGDAELMSLLGSKVKKLPKGHPPPGTLKQAIYQTRLPERCTPTLEVWKVDVSRKIAYYAAWVEYGHANVARFKGKYTDYPVKGKGRQTGLAGRRSSASTRTPPHSYMRVSFDATKNEAFQAMADYIRANLPIALNAQRAFKVAA